MINLTNLLLIVGAMVCFASCASMSPAKVNQTLPTLTKSTFISQSQAEEAVRTNRCRYLVKGRNYAAPLGLTTKGDLKLGAKGIDEWVQLDGGNTYVLLSYKWVKVDHYGSTQLHIDFDTMKCEE